MNYEKLTPERFTEKLKGGEYDSLTGARRAVGKSSWSETAKNKARVDAEKHFGLKPAAPKAAKKVTAKAPKEKVVKANARARAADPAVVGTNAPVMNEHRPSGAFAIGGKQLTAAEVRKNPFQAIQIAEHVISSATTVINSLAAMKQQDATVDITDPMRAAVQSIKGALELSTIVINNVTGDSAKSQALNGTVLPPETEVPGDPVYTAPTPAEA